jgi:DNA-directed RNA polymerase sigma subunit (sigma70/sigma32)
MTYVWPSEDGWPYPDGDGHPVDVDLDGAMDDDVMAVLSSPHLLDHLEPLERQIIRDHYGLGGRTARSMKELCIDLDLPRADVRDALGAGLSKLRIDLAAG